MSRIDIIIMMNRRIKMSKIRFMREIVVMMNE